MKKLFAILVIAATLASCGGGASDKTPAADTTKPAVVAPVDTTSKMAVDTSKKFTTVADTTKKAADVKKK